jgi:hypothetical protein
MMIDGINSLPVGISCDIGTLHRHGVSGLPGYGLLTLVGLLIGALVSFLPDFESAQLPVQYSSKSQRQGNGSQSAKEINRERKKEGT